jgi:hypothetical protein
MLVYISFLERLLHTLRDFSLPLVLNNFLQITVTVDFRFHCRILYLDFIHLNYPLKKIPNLSSSVRTVGKGPG